MQVCLSGQAAHMSPQRNAEKAAGGKRHLALLDITSATDCTTFGRAIIAHRQWDIGELLIRTLAGRQRVPAEQPRCPHITRGPLLSLTNQSALYTSHG
jgi:hypothetical protein